GEKLKRNERPATVARVCGRRFGTGLSKPRPPARGPGLFDRVAPAGRGRTRRRSDAKRLRRAGPQSAVSRSRRPARRLAPQNDAARSPPPTAHGTATQTSRRNRCRTWHDHERRGFIAEIAFARARRSVDGTARKGPPRRAPAVLREQKSS